MFTITSQYIIRKYLCLLVEFEVFPFLFLLSPAEEGHLHVSPEQNVSDGGQFGGTALHLQALLLHSHLTQVIAVPRL